MEKNIQLLRQTMKHILANPQNHNQETWFSPDYGAEDVNMCNTTMCFAGHAAVLAGGQTPNPKTFDGDWYLKLDGTLSNQNEYVTSLYEDTEQQVLRVSKWAQRKLGLNPYEYEYLFMFMGDAEDVADRVERLAELWESGQEMTDWDID